MISREVSVQPRRAERRRNDKVEAPIGERSEKNARKLRFQDEPARRGEIATGTAGAPPANCYTWKAVRTRNYRPEHPYSLGQAPTKSLIPIG